MCLLSNTLCGLALYVPSMRGAFHGAWRLHQTWRRTEPARQVPPITLLGAQAAAGVLTQQGFWRLGSLVILAFDGILRTAELMELLPQDFTLRLQVAT